MIYGSLKPISQISKAKRVKFAGHYFRASFEVISSLLLWKQKRTVQRSRKLTFPDTISRDAGLKTYDMGTAMRDRDSWRQRVKIKINYLDRGRTMMMMIKLIKNESRNKGVKIYPLIWDRKVFLIHTE